MVCCGRVRLGSLSGCRCGRVGPLGTSGCGQLPVPRRAGAEGGVGGSLPGVRVSQPGSTRRRQGVAGERPVASGVAWRVNASGRAGISWFNKERVTPDLSIGGFQSRYPRPFPASTRASLPLPLTLGYFHATISGGMVQLNLRSGR